MMEASRTDLAVLLRGGAPGVGRRKAVNRAMEAVSTAAAFIAVAVLVIVIASVFIKGASALNLDFLIHNPAPFGASGGGIANSIVGSALLVAIASAMAIPLGILIAIHTTEFAGPRVSNVIRFALDILNGVPTIVTGVFIFGLLVVGHTQSGWAGAIALAVVMLPIVARSAQEVLGLVPRTLHEAAAALGIPRWRAVVRIIVPTAAGGLITGAVLGVARIAGETAPLLFTSSIAANTLVTNPSQAFPNIPVTIFGLSESPSPQDHASAWAAALMLILFVLILSVTARLLNERSRRRIRG
jgi:phosphate transport system permease protein